MRRAAVLTSLALLPVAAVAPAAHATAARPPKIALFDVNRWGESFSINATVSFGRTRSGIIRVKATCGTRGLVDWRVRGYFLAKTSGQIKKGSCGGVGTVKIVLSWIETTPGAYKRTWSKTYRR